MSGVNLYVKLEGYPLGEKYLFGSECRTKVGVSFGSSDRKLVFSVVISVFIRDGDLEGYPM